MTQTLALSLPRMRPESARATSAVSNTSGFGAAEADPDVWAPIDRGNARTARARKRRTGRGVWGSAGRRRRPSVKNTLALLGAGVESR